MNAATVSFACNFDKAHFQLSARILSLHNSTNAAENLCSHHNHHKDFQNPARLQYKLMWSPVCKNWSQEILCCFLKSVSFVETGPVTRNIYTTINYLFIILALLELVICSHNIMSVKIKLKRNISNDCCRIDIAIKWSTHYKRLVAVSKLTVKLLRAQFTMMCG